MKDMTITYEVDGALYVNITNRCSNRCDFCIRNNGDGAYGSNSLWLSREPTCDEIFESIVASNPENYSELVFCGYGEPTERLDDLICVAKKVKERHGEGYDSVFITDDGKYLSHHTPQEIIKLSARTEAIQKLAQKL